MHRHSHVHVALRTGAVAMGLACAAALAADPHGSNAAAEAKAKEQQTNNRTGHANDGEGAFWISPQDETIAFGRQPLNVKRTESFSVHNTRDTAVRIANVDVRAVTGNAENAFAINNGCKDLLPPNQQCRVDVTFQPGSEGYKAVEVRVVAADNSVRLRKVTGTGVKAQYTATPNRLSFGRVARDGSSKSQTVKITNTGDVMLPVHATSLSGPNDKQFTQSNNCPKELGVGKSCEVTVLFKPTFQGEHQATLNVWARGGAPDTTISVAGTGGAGEQNAKNNGRGNGS